MSDNMWRAALGVPDLKATQQSGGRNLVDPIGTAVPEAQQYTDFAHIIHKPGGIDYQTGMNMAETEAAEDAEEKRRRAAAASAKVQAAGMAAKSARQGISTVTPMKKGGKVKAKPTSKPKVSSASRRADGIASKGKTKGRMI